MDIRVESLTDDQTRELDTRPGYSVQPLRLDKGKGHIPVQHAAIGQAGFLPTAFSEELLDLVAARRKGGGGGRGTGW